MRDQTDRVVRVSPGDAATEIGRKETLVSSTATNHRPVGANHVAHGPFQLLDGLQRRTQVVDVVEKDPSGIHGRLLSLAAPVASRWQMNRQDLHGGLAGY